jgi:hypothetical protein
MPTKFELAEYLVNLNTLLEAQASTGITKSSVIAEEYDRVWDELKSTITKEQTDETRTSDYLNRRIDQIRTNFQSSQS